MHVSNIDHVTVIITDLERSRRFYRDVLRLKEVPCPKTFDFVVLWFQLPADQTLHLLLKPVSDSISPRHFCLHVDDIEAARAHCRKHGLKIDETVRIPHADRFFIHDPDGNRIELIHWDQPYDPSVG